MAMHATSKAPYDAPDSFLAELDKLCVANVLVATGEFDHNLVADPGGSYDRVIVSGGGIRYDGTLKLVFTGGYTPVNGDNYQLFDITGGHTGTFLNFYTGSVPVEFDAPTGLLTVVPEPSTWVLLALCALALSAMRWKEKLFAQARRVSRLASGSKRVFFVEQAAGNLPIGWGCRDADAQRGSTGDGVTSSTGTVFHGEARSTFFCPFV